MPHAQANPASVCVYLYGWFYYDANKTNKPKHVSLAWEAKKRSSDRK